MAETLHLRASGVSVLLALSPDLLPRVVHWGADLGDLDADGALAAVHASTPAVRL